MNPRRLPRFVGIVVVGGAIIGSTDTWARFGSRVGPGVVVEKVNVGGAADRAGIRADDILLSWNRAASPPANPNPENGSINDWFDLSEVELEQAPRGVVTLAGNRDGAQIAFDLPPGDWKLTVRPRLIGGDLADWLEATLLLKNGDQEREGIARWEALEARASTHSSSRRLALWLRIRIADELARIGDRGSAHAVARRAIVDAEFSQDWVVAAIGWSTVGSLFQLGSDPEAANAPLSCELEARERLSATNLALASSLNKLGHVALDRGDLTAAESFYLRAFGIRERLAPQSLAFAMSLNSLGNLASDRGDLSAAEKFYHRSLAIIESLAPHSLLVAASLNNLGNVATDRGNLAAAESFHRRSLAIREELTPGSLDVTVSLNNLGNVALFRGDLAAAESLYRSSLRIRQVLSPESLDVATSLNNLGGIAVFRGNLADAEGLFRRSLAIREALVPESLDVAASFNNLGAVSRKRGDLALTERLLRLSLAINEKLAPGSLAVARNVNNLATVAWDRGDLAAAENLCRRSLTVIENLGPESLDVAAALNNLGEVSADRGDFFSAESYYRRSLKIREALAPGSLGVATSLLNQSKVAAGEGDQSAADSLLTAAISIVRRLAPGSDQEARIHYSRGEASLALGLRGEAADHWCEALRSLEVQSSRLGGSDEAKAGFAANYTDWYRDYASFLVESGNADEAFHILERGRARGLLSLLAERDLVLAADIPANLEKERKLAAAEYDRAQATLAELSASDASTIETIEWQMREIRRRQDEVKGSIREASPRLASLVYPEPLDLPGARKLLDPGTLLLAYSLGTKGGLLFLMGPGENHFEVVRLAASREAIEEKTRRFRMAIQRAAESSSPGRSDAVRQAAIDLGSILLAPAAKKIAAAKRLLVIPDGPLHFVPFSALTLPTNPSRWLIETKPVSSVVSITVYGELLANRKERAESRPIEAFGDPDYPAGSAGRLRGLGNLDPLPATRTEVEAIRVLAPADTRAHLAGEATESAAKGIGRDASVVHFACHGVVDERFPLDSALVLSLPETAPDVLAENRNENGVLQAWEIFESVRLDADLVTLSACETAMGKELGGEGLVGLVRAFEFAGARSVLASLWSVSDESTARLMESFYRRWLGGTPKDEALRLAQVELLNSGFTSPFHWAAFELIGDWQ